MDVNKNSSPNANLVIIEIGNSHISAAAWSKGAIRTQWRFPLDRLDDAAAHALLLWDALPEDFQKAVVVASVVPNTLKSLRPLLADRLKAPVQVVGEDLHRPMSLAIEAPEQVGIDRICCAAAAYEQIRESCVTASFGTAITIDCVNDQGVFLGGAILPGLAMQALGLHEGTAQLPEVAIEETGAVYGVTTEQAIRNGIIYGAVGALREITERYATDLGQWPRLVVTGGNAEIIKRHSEFIDHVVPDLCIRGIALAYRRHFSPLEELGEQPE